MRTLAVAFLLLISGCTSTTEVVMVCFWGCVVEDQSGSTDATATTEESSELDLEGI